MLHAAQAMRITGPVFGLPQASVDEAVDNRSEGDNVVDDVDDDDGGVEQEEVDEEEEEEEATEEGPMTGGNKRHSHSGAGSKHRGDFCVQGLDLSVHCT